MKHPAPKLSVLIATFRPKGIRRVEKMRLPEMPDVEYVVSWQEHGDAPVPTSIANRNDITVIRFDKKGVSRNRNNAIDHAKGEIMLMADDDLTYTKSQLNAVIDTFDANPETDYASFMYAGASHKTYPATETGLGTLPRFFSQSCIEIAIRRNNRTASLRFNHDFGPGAPLLTAGEDELFLLTARKKKLNCRFFPIVITAHPQPSTGARKINDPGILKACGALIALSHPATFIPRVAVNAFRIQKSKRATTAKAFFHMTHGALFACFNHRIRKSLKP